MGRAIPQTPLHRSDDRSKPSPERSDKTLRRRREPIVPQTPARWRQFCDLSSMCITPKPEVPPSRAPTGGPAFGIQKRRVLKIEEPEIGAVFERRDFAYFEAIHLRKRPPVGGPPSYRRAATNFERCTSRRLPFELDPSPTRNGIVFCPQAALVSQ
jgi:hypothetical protein